MKIIIVEDEGNNVKLIEEYLKKINFEVQIIGIAASVSDAVELINKCNPDLVLFDVMIKGGSAFNVLELVENNNFERIFITAFNDYAIDAIKQHAIDYILKPIHFDEFNLALNKSKERIEQKILLKSIELEKTGQYFTIRTHSGSELIPIHSIVYFEADGSYTLCVTETSTLVVSKNIGDIEKEILGFPFFRCHHSFIINSKHIKKIELNRSGYITCSNDKILPVSQRKKKEFVDFMKNVS